MLIRNILFLCLLVYLTSCATTSSRTDVERKLRDIKFREITLVDAEIPVLLDLTSAESKNLDPQHQGVQFVIGDAPGLSDRTWTLSVKDIPLIEFIQLFASKFHCEYQIQGTKVIFFRRETRNE